MSARHLTEEQFAGYRSRTLAAVDLLQVDEHLSGCSNCRDRLADAAGAVSAIRDLQARLLRHLEYDEVVAAAEGNPGAEAVRHLAGCELCRAEVDDLRGFRRELKTVAM